MIIQLKGLGNLLSNILFISLSSETSKRRFIEKTVEVLSEKLEFLNVNSLNISPLKIVAVQLQVSHILSIRIM